MANKKRRLIIGSIMLVGMCIAAIKMDVLQVVYAKVDDAMTETTTIRYNQDNYNSDAMAVISPDLTHQAFCTGTKEFFVKELSTGTITTYPTEEKIYQLKYSPNGIYLAAGRNILNVETGKVTQLATDVKMSTSFDHIAFSPSSEKLAIVNVEHVQYPRPTIVEIWNMQTEQLIQKLSNDHLIKQMAFSKDERYLVFAGREITLWDIQEGKCIKTLVTDSMPSDNELLSHIHYEAIAYSPDGKHLAAVLRSNYYNNKIAFKDQARQTEVIEIWDPEQGIVIQTLSWDTKGNMYKLQYSPDGQYLASGKSFPDDMIHEAVWIWDVSQGKVVKKLTQFPDGNLTAMDYSADGSHLSLSGYWNTKIWKIK